MAILSQAAGLMRQWGELGLDLLFPAAEWKGGMPRKLERPFCEQCAQPYWGEIEGTFVCYNCQQRSWSLHWARAMYRAEGVVRKSIHDFKYEGRFYWVKVLTQWLEEGFNAWAGSEPWDALVPVPLHVLRLRERGFNQARELARTLGQRVSLPCWDVLVRNKETTSQTYLERHQRLRNMRKAFHLKQPDWWGRFDVEGKNLLIIDDVFTTGATTDACARVLRKHGAARVAALTIARG